MELPSVFSLLRIGIGPSSSHTLGPLLAALEFRRALEHAPAAGVRVRVRLLGSLALTGRGHLTDAAVTAGLAGFELGRDPRETVADAARGVAAAGRIAVGGRALAFAPSEDVVFDVEGRTGAHPNTLVFQLLDAAGGAVLERTYLSVGGGRITEGGSAVAPRAGDVSMERVLDACLASGRTLAEYALENERRAYGIAAGEARAKLAALWDAMTGSIGRGLATEGLLPGALRLERRAPEMFENYQKQIRKWGLLSRDVTLAAVYAIAVAEENAAGGSVVTAPTCGSAGIVPAVLQMLKERFRLADARLEDALLVAGVVGVVVAENASISGAEVGCQGEVGVASAMAAAAAVHLLDGSPLQAESAAEIALEHHLGLTCDPVCGLVQVPCIERNAVGAVTALNAANLALLGSGKHLVSFDTAVATMRQVGLDMGRQYKETSLGGLATAGAPARPPAGSR